MKASDMTNQGLAVHIESWKNTGMWNELPPAVRGILLESARRLRTESERFLKIVRENCGDTVIEGSLVTAILEASPMLAEGEDHTTTVLGPQARKGMADELREFADDLEGGAQYVSGGAMVTPGENGVRVLTAALVVRKK